MSAQEHTVTSNTAKLVLDLFQPDTPITDSVYAVTHGYTRSRSQMTHFCRGLTEHGIPAARYAMRGHEKSTGEYSVDEAAKDVVNVAEYLRGLGFSRVFTGGYSAGGHVVLRSMIYDKDDMVDGAFAIQAPVWPREHELRNYPKAILINRTTANLLERYPWIAPLVDSRLKKRPDGLWWINSAHTQDLVQFRYNSWGPEPAVNFADRADGHRILLEASYDDWHVRPKDTIKIANAFLSAGSNVGLLMERGVNPAKNRSHFRRFADRTVRYFEPGLLQ